MNHLKNLFLLCLFIMIGATRVMADSSSYTISFSNSVKSATAISSTTKASTTIASESCTYVTTQPYTINDGNCYYGDTQTCIRVGKSNSSGSLSIGLSDAGKVTPTSIVVHGYTSSNKNVGGSLTVNGVSEASSTTFSTDEADFTYNFTSGTEITSITLVTTKAFYINSITVNYGSSTPATTHTLTITQPQAGGSFTVTDSDSETVSSGASIAEGVELTLSATPAEHYTFTSWDITGTGSSVSGNTFTMGTDDATISATFTEDAKYSVSYEANGGTGTDPTTADQYSGAQFTLPANPYTKTGYKFAGWSDGSQTYAVGDEYTMPAQAVTFTAQWEEKTTPTFSIGNLTVTLGDAITPVIVTNNTDGCSVTYTSSDDDIVLAVDDELEAEAVGTATITATMAETDNFKVAQTTFTVTVNAKSATAHSLTIEQSTGGTISANPNGTIEQGTEVTLTATPDAHYTFTSWYVLDGEANEVTVTDNKFTMPSSATTVTATFTEDTKYSVTFVKGVDDATGDDPTTENQYAGATITLPANPYTYTNHTFAGWSDGSQTYAAGDEYTITKDVTMTAVWNDAYAVDFESETDVYTDWTFDKMLSKVSKITAHGGSYHGTTGGNGTAYIQTAKKIKTPGAFTCYVSKCTSNTTSSTWYIQISTDATSWTNVAAQSATSMNQGNWVKFSADLSSYNDVYVRVYYKGSTAIRAIDDIELTYTPGTQYTITTSSVENGSITVSNETAEEGDEITLTETPDDGYKFSGWNVYKTDDSETKVTVTGNAFTMPAYDVTVSATFVAKDYTSYSYISGVETGNSADATAYSIDSPIHAALSADNGDKTSALYVTGTGSATNNYVELSLTKAAEGGEAIKAYVGASAVLTDNSNTSFIIDFGTKDGEGTFTSLTTTTFGDIQAVYTDYTIKEGIVPEEAAGANVLRIYRGTQKSSACNIVVLQIGAATETALVKAAAETEDATKGTAYVNKVAVVAGTEVTFTAEPKTNYHFTKWSDETTDNPYNVTVSEATTLTASFALDQYTITAQPNEGGTYTVTVGDAEPVEVTDEEVSILNVDYGTTIVLTPSVNSPRYIIDGAPFSLTVPEGSTTPAFSVLENDARSFKLGASDVTVNAQYVKRYKLTLAANEGNMTWTVNDTEKATGDVIWYKPTTPVTSIMVEVTAGLHTTFNSLTVTADDGTTEIPSLTIEDGLAMFDMPEADVIATANMTLQTTFAINKSVNDETMGSLSVTLNDIEVTEAEEDAQVFVTATPNLGYRFTGWTVSDNIVLDDEESATTYFIMPDDAVTVQANFEVIPTYTLTLTPNTYGTLELKIDDQVTELDANNQVMVPEGKLIQVTASPVAHYTFTSWSVTGVTSSEDENVVTFLMPTQAVTVGASFTEDAKCAVTFVVRGEQFGDVQEVYYDGTYAEAFDEVGTPANDDTDFEDYTFAGWSTTMNETGLVEASATVQTGTLYAIFSKAGATTWTRVTSVNTLTDGGTFIMGYEETANSGVIVPMRSDGSAATTTRNGILYSGTTAGESNSGTIDMNSITETSAYEITVAASTTTSGAITIKLADGNYIGNDASKNTAYRYASACTNADYTPTIGENDVVTLTSPTSVSTTYTTLQYNTGSPRFCNYGGKQKDVVFYKKTTAAPTYSAEYPDVEITITSATRGTFVSEYPLDFTDSEVIAYVCTGKDGDVLTMQNVKKVAAGEALYVAGTKGTYKVKVCTDTEYDEINGVRNYLVGVLPTTENVENGLLEIQQEDGEYTNFILQKKDSGLKFYKVNGTTGNKVGVHRAYLQLPTNELSSNAKGYFEIDLGDGTTDIISVDTDTTQSLNGVAYDLNGRVTRSNAKGIVIVNGKKVFNK